MPAAVKSIPGELLVDLGMYKTFEDMKKGLEEQLRFHDLPVGSLVSIEIGNRRLNNKQLRHIEDILLDYGLHLKEISLPRPPVEAEGGEAEETVLIENMPQYEETVLICRHIRSGQKFLSRGNVVVVGDVNPGAEVIAGGNILVMGSLRGMAHAGAFGDEKAIVSAYRLNPTQLRIANHITRPPDGETIIVHDPELARIRAGKVVIEKLKI